MNRWSHAEGDVVDVDVVDGSNVICYHCGDVFDIEEEGSYDDDDAFCESCFNHVFGGPTHE